MKQRYLNRWNNCKTWLLWLFCALGLSAASLSAQAENLADYHKSKNLECNACHVENVQTPPTPATCESCHQDYFDKTIDAWPNAHASPHLQPTDEVPCTTCHKGHTPMVVTCQTCHENFQFNKKF